MPDNLSWLRGTHVVKMRMREPASATCILTPVHALWPMYEHAHVHIHTPNTHIPVCLKQWSNQKGMSGLETVNQEQRMVMVPDTDLVV